MRIFIVGLVVLMLAACSPAPAPRPDTTQPPLLPPETQEVLLPQVVGPSDATQAVLLPQVVNPPVETQAVQLPLVIAPGDASAAGDIPYTPGAGLPPGLVYTLGAGDGLWIIGADGRPRKLLDGYQPALSPDGRQALYSIAYEGDIWLADLASGEVRNLTNTPETNETGYMWWPGSANTILFYYKPMNADGISNGSLAMMRSDGSGYQVVDGADGSLGQAAPSPDGRTIALDQVGQPALYTAEGGLQPLNLEDYGIQAGGAINPAWSPDGKRLAWVLTGAGQNGVAVLDLEGQQGVQFHPFSAGPGGGGQPALSYSPDGQWLALTSFEAGKSGPVIWALSADGSQEIAVGNGVGPVWSPDSRFLVFTHTPAGAGSFLGDQVLLAQVGAWEPLPLALDAGARPIGWVRVSP